MERMYLYTVAILIALVAFLAIMGSNNSGVRNESATFQVIKMNVTMRGFEPAVFHLKRGVPVNWIIDGQQLSGCNSKISVPDLNLMFDIKKGNQTISFVPVTSGDIDWSCWMGMLRGRFVVE